ncbi:MAG: NAD(P)H-binding protein [Herpetosiphonaceae bacterium]|nr:NAD(P)H-binding protein [Herpetosiphonaceae bacterium]
MSSENTVLVLGGTGKTGRRIIQRLHERSLSVRSGSRSATPAFDWADETTWTAALQDISSVYIAFQPDLAVPGAVATIQKFVDLAVQSGVRRLVLLSGRGEAEAQSCEEIVQRSGVDWTILRASWFFQNFSENFLLDALLSPEVYLPAGEVQEPFIDADDIADVAVAALTEAGHAGQVYELTGPRMLTFADAVAEIAAASGRSIRYQQVPIAAYVAALEAEQVPSDMVWLVQYLFTTVLDGRNAYVADGVQRALGRPPGDFSAYVHTTAAAGVWNS